MDPVIVEETQRDPVVENNNTKGMTQTTLAGGRVEVTDRKIDEREIEEQDAEQDDVAVVIPLSNDASQRSLFSLKKVVRMGKSMTSVSFTAQDLQNLKKKLEDASTGKHELLQSLRLLQCYRLCLEDLKVSGLGGVVRVLSMVHPKEEVQKAAGNMMQKWKRMVLRELFPLPRSVNESADVDETFGYDVAAAKEAPEGCDVPPEELIRLEEEDALYEKMRRKRERIEEDPFCSSTDEDEESDSDMWSPSMERRRRAAKMLAARRRASGTDEGPSPDENKLNETNTIEANAPAPKKRLSKAFQNLFAKGKAESDDKPLKETIDLASCEDDAHCQ